MAHDPKRLAYVDTAGSICWFIMDASWMLGIVPAAVALSVPTVLLAAASFRYVERTGAALFVTGAMLSWACMNVAWMLHDVGLSKEGLNAAAAFFVTGAAQLLAALIAAKSGRGSVEALLGRFRRMRIPKR